MHAFVLSILSSIIAALILVIFSSLFSRNARGLLFAIIAKLLKMDLEAVFATKKDAEQDIEKNLRRAKYIYMLTGRGNELQRGFFSDYLSDKNAKRKKRIRIILPDIEVKNGETDWIGEREKELSQFDSLYGNDILKKQISTTYMYLQTSVSESRVELKCSNLPLVHRILLTDTVLYLTPYSTHCHARDSEVIKFRRGGPLYAHYERFFELIWSKSEEVSWDLNKFDKLPRYILK